MENLYDELSKKAIASATVPRRGKNSFRIFNIENFEFFKNRAVMAVEVKFCIVKIFHVFLW